MKLLSKTEISVNITCQEIRLYNYVMKLAGKACDLVGSKSSENIPSLKKIKEHNIKELLAAVETSTDTSIYSKLMYRLAK